MTAIILQADDFVGNQKELEEQFAYEFRQELRFKVLLVEEWTEWDVEMAQIQAQTEQ